MKKQNTYSYRDPWTCCSVITYLQRPKNFVQHEDIIDFAHNKQWGFDIIINFMNAQFDHYQTHQGKKIIVKYEDLKKDDDAWRKMIELIFGSYADAWDEEAFEYAKSQTTFEKMQEKNNAMSDESFTGEVVPLK